MFLGFLAVRRRRLVGLGVMALVVILGGSAANAQDANAQAQDIIEQMHRLANTYQRPPAASVQPRDNSAHIGPPHDESKAGEAIGDLITFDVVGLAKLLKHQQKAHEDVNAANARVSTAVRAEGEARARNDRAAAARAMAAEAAARDEAEAAAERERAATAAYISERNKLAAQMMGDRGDAPIKMMGDLGDTPRTLMGDGGSQSRAGDELAGMGFGGGNAACIFEGRPECLMPVVRLQVRPNHPAIPEDTAAFEQSLPAGALTNPRIMAWLNQLDSQANHRADKHDSAAKDKKDAIAHPDNPAPARDAVVYAGQMTGAQKDEEATKEKIIRMVHFDGTGQIPTGKVDGGTVPVPGGGGTSPQ